MTTSSTTLRPPTTNESQPILHVMGDNNLQTKILTVLLSDNLDIECRIVNDIAEMTPEKINPGYDLLLIDCHQVEINRIKNLLAETQGAMPGARIALFNTSPDSAYEKLAEWPQVKGMFFDMCDHAQLLRGMRELLNNGHWLPRHIMHRLLENNRRAPLHRQPSVKLTRREGQILAHLSHGATNMEIAATLHLSEHTIKSHLYNIFKKIGARNRLQASNWARKHLTA